MTIQKCTCNCRHFGGSYTLVNVSLHQLLRLKWLKVSSLKHKYRTSAIEDKNVLLCMSKASDLKDTYHWISKVSLFAPSDKARLSSADTVSVSFLTEDKDELLREVLGQHCRDLIRLHLKCFVRFGFAVKPDIGDRIFFFHAIVQLHNLTRIHGTGYRQSH